MSGFVVMTVTWFYMGRWPKSLDDGVVGVLLLCLLSTPMQLLSGTVVMMHLALLWLA